MFHFGKVFLQHFFPFQTCMSNVSIFFQDNGLFKRNLSFLTKKHLESTLSSFLTLEMWKYCWALVVSNSLMVMKRRVPSKFFTFSGWRHYLQKVLLDWNGQAVLSSIIFYLFGLERQKQTKRDHLGFSFLCFFQTL